MLLLNVSIFLLVEPKPLQEYNSFNFAFTLHTPQRDALDESDKSYAVKLLFRDKYV